MSWKKSLTVLKSLLLLCFICTQTPFLLALEKDRIIGENDLQPAGKSKFPAQIIDSIGILAIGCTVTHIGGGIAITAGHCFSDKETRLRRNLPCRSDNYDVQWGVNHEQDPTLESHCVKILETEFSENFDYAIFKVDPSPKSSIAVNLAQAVSGSKISIFSHPDSRPLEWSQFCALEPFQPNQIQYECDTEAGSSGAAVLDKNWGVVAIHNGYSPVHNKNGGTLIANIPYFKRVRKTGRML